MRSHSTIHSYFKINNNTYRHNLTERRRRRRRRRRGRDEGRGGRGRETRNEKLCKVNIAEVILLTTWTIKTNRRPRRSVAKHCVRLFCVVLREREREEKLTPVEKAGENNLKHIQTHTHTCYKDVIRQRYQVYIVRHTH